MRRRCSLLAACALACSAPLARAAGPAEDPARPHPPPPVDEFQEPPRTQGDEITEAPYFDTPYLTLTLHPLLLINPVGQAAVEVKIHQKLSVGALIGGGSVRAKAPLTGAATRLGYLTVGAQARYYVLQGFGSGFFVALDVDYNRLDTDQLVNLTLINTAAGLGVGPLAGFKLVLPRGTTIDLGFGLKRLLLRPTPSVPSAADAGDQPANYLLALRLGLGWTF
jgi:hypothetical protein